MRPISWIPRSKSIFFVLDFKSVATWTVSLKSMITWLYYDFILFFVCRTEDFVILHGDHHSLSDTVGFLRRLVELHALASTGNSSLASCENLAAAAIFNWEVLNIQLWLL